MAWTDYASAPPPGTVICAATGLAGARCLEVVSPAGRFPLILVATAQGPRAYVNACPHQFLPLNYRSDTVLSADGTRLLCSAHGARFDAGTGAAPDGPGLDPVPIEERDGMICIGPAA
ncbi:Rieske (2Fe-2S) protein [Plastorhodobacter daqingensis]|uniref:Rieske (2Fe-2S) protein n=1 Tax=Plastorhodobacter daqingensis TaxID=1387281 RepID=A0ABW2UMN1_9RHOB